ncbi:MAG: hypothetical protein FRX48_01098 [Lasallia pustulata]|uniref:Six-hairpin glycosidase-like n=1 Tax=Lasallia pustulata TaxID=136370 RepID=A0A5M8Q2K2_9LECA|nr:MAG: hypothetical protein FRX48_01098 [Lasallia pustulata]
MTVRLLGWGRFPRNQMQFIISFISCCLIFLLLTTAHAQILQDAATWVHGLAIQPQRIAATDRQPPLDVPPSTHTQDELDVERTSLASLPALLDALDLMQSKYFELWQGTWTGAIDWTAAVMGTHVSATLSAVTAARNITPSPPDIEGHTSLEESALRHENLVNRYFTQITSFYFGENAFSLRAQAYDDMLWVVLGWLESIKFIKLHSSPPLASSSRAVSKRVFQDNSSTWYGNQFIPSFAHRAHLFYDLASQGWDTSLCGGGMIWNPYLAPYKNAITNQLYIAASVSMYLYFPGDQNASPFNSQKSEASKDGIPPAKVHDTKYLNAAVEAYKWLKESNMTNAAGLYVDGFHIHGWRRTAGNSSNGTGACDVRDEMVYTYNQGVLLSGLRGLWDATGTRAYLEEGHSLIRNVTAATGWPLASLRDRFKWAGLGRNGVLEEACDASGRCSQDGQTFKGIFFHHLTLFCAPLLTGAQREGDVMWRADAETASLHRESCAGYRAWVTHNAQAAWRTRNAEGEFGMWWGWAYAGADGERDADTDADVQTPSRGTDYRNRGVPKDAVWRLPGDEDAREGESGDEDARWREEGQDACESMDGSNSCHINGQGQSRQFPRRQQQQRRDPNNRGRGRTVETQSGGLAVLRAMFLLVDIWERGVV